MRVDMPSTRRLPGDALVPSSLFGLDDAGGAFFISHASGGARQRL